jgi:GNAT superfamily N-acetyltransferase
MLFVRPPWWGSGLAARLHGLAVQEAGLRGYEALRLHTPAGNARARAFYEREGWHAVGRPIPEPLLGLDLVEYRRDL